MSRRPSIRSRQRSLSATNRMESHQDPHPTTLTIKIRKYCCQTTCCLHIDGDDVPEVIYAKWKWLLKPVIFLAVLVTVGVVLYFYLRPIQDTVCFIRVGCFSLSGPWAARPVLFNYYPQSPLYINTTFIVTSRDDPEGSKGVVSMPGSGHFGVINEQHIPWNRSSIIVFLVHGFTDRSGTWMRTLKDAFLAQGEDIIVVLVDWELGAAGAARYPQVVANTRVVAREMVLFIKYIQRKFGHPSAPKKIHLVGHSLGSQISSYVGKEFANTSYPIYQITALDPAFPLFEDYPEEIRLHKTDARHVLVVHSNIGFWGLGMKDPVGTVDIYLNDGRDQRGCFKMGIFKNKDGSDGVEPSEMKCDNTSLPKVVGDFSSINDKLACNHRRAYVWLEDILRDLAGEKFVPVGETHTTNHVIGYPIVWRKGSEVLTLTRSRSIKHSFCKKDDDDGHGCWILSKSDSDGFIKLPQPSNSSTYLIPTTDKPPFCARFALLKIWTCPEASPILSIFRKGANRFPRNVTLSLAQIVYNDEIPIYHGSHKSLGSSITAWVEFPCNQLQEQSPSSFTKFSKHSDFETPSFLSVQLLVSINDEDDIRSSKNSTHSVKTLEPSFCASKMELDYYHETSGRVLRSTWIENLPNGEPTLSYLRAGQCIDLLFAV